MSQQQQAHSQQEQQQHDERQEHHVHVALGREVFSVNVSPPPGSGAREGGIEEGTPHSPHHEPIHVRCSGSDAARLHEQHAELRRTASSALLWRPAPLEGQAGVSTAPNPLHHLRAHTPLPAKRSNSAFMRTNTIAVRNSLLANLFFPAEDSHRVTTVDEAKASRHRLLHGHTMNTSEYLRTPREANDDAAAGRSDKSTRHHHHRRRSSGVGDAELSPCPTPLSVAERGSEEDDASDTAAHDAHNDSFDPPVPPDTILETLARAIQSKHGQWFFTALLVLDVVLIIAELIIEGNQHCVLEPVHDVRRVSAMYNTTNEWCNATTLSYLGRPESHPRARFFEASQAMCPFEAIAELPPGLHTAEGILQWASKSIIFAFAAELLVLMAALRVHFFRNKMYVLDAVIVAVSVIVDWTVSDQQPSVQLLVVVRCWRFARILHGVGSSVHETEVVVVEQIVDDSGHFVREDVTSISGRSRRSSSRRERSVRRDAEDTDMIAVVMDDNDDSANVSTSFFGSRSRASSATTAVSADHSVDEVCADNEMDNSHLNLTSTFRQRAPEVSVRPRSDDDEAAQLKA